MAGSLASRAWRRAIVGAVVGAVAAGCAGWIDRKAASSTYRILVQSMEAAKGVPDLELAEAALPGGLIQLEGFALAYPDHRGFRELHAESTCQYVTGFVFDRWEDASLAGREAEAAQLATRLGPLLARCVEANLQLLPAAWREARRRGPDAVVGQLASARREEVAALLRIAMADAVTLSMDPMRHLAQLPAIRGLLARTAELAPGFHDADAEIMLGTLQAAQARLLGGPDGDELFARARTLAGEGALMVEVMYARGVAVARKDRAEFEAILERVIAADVERWPHRRLANELARRKAARYLAAAPRWFP